MNTNKQPKQRLWVAIPFYNASLSTTKLSILFQYLRIFPNRRFRLSCYLVISLVVAFGIWAVVSGFLNCVPVERFWDDSVQGHCLSFAGVWLFNASFNMATDLTLLVLPMPMLLHLQLPRRQRNGLMVLFALGGLYGFPFSKLVDGNADDDDELGLYLLVLSGFIVSTSSQKRTLMHHVRTSPKFSVHIKKKKNHTNKRKQGQTQSAQPGQQQNATPQSSAPPSLPSAR